MIIEQVDIRDYDADAIHSAIRWQLWQDICVVLVACMFLLFITVIAWYNYTQHGYVEHISEPRDLEHHPLLLIFIFCAAVCGWACIALRSFRDLHTDHLFRMSHMTADELSVRKIKFIRKIDLRAERKWYISSKIIKPTPDRVYLFRNIDKCQDLVLTITPHRNLVVDISGTCEAKRWPDIFYERFPLFKIGCVLVVIWLSVMIGQHGFTWVDKINITNLPARLSDLYYSK